MLRLLTTTFALLVALTVTGLARADTVPGQYSLEVSLSPATGNAFRLDASITHAAPSFSSAQWEIDYDQSIVRVVSINRAAAAPTECHSAADTGDVLLLACIDLLGPNLSYSGTAWNVVILCVNTGPTAFTLVETTGSTAKTAVKIGSTNQPIHTHDVTGTCTADPDSDGDGCGDVEEVGSNRLFGGDRDPLDPWDFFDVSGDQSIDLTDALLIKQKFGLGPGDPGYDAQYDRWIPDMAKPWRTASASDGIDLTDILINLQSFGHDCSA